MLITNSRDASPEKSRQHNNIKTAKRHDAQCSLFSSRQRHKKQSSLLSPFCIIFFQTVVLCLCLSDHHGTVGAMNGSSSKQKGRQSCLLKLPTCLLSPSMSTQTSEELLLQAEFLQRILLMAGLLGFQANHQHQHHHHQPSNQLSCCDNQIDGWCRVSGQ